MKKSKSLNSKNFYFCLFIELMLNCQLFAQTSVSDWNNLLGPSPGSPGLIGYYYFDGNDTVFVAGSGTGILQFTPNVSLKMEDAIDLGYLPPYIIPSGAQLVGDFDLLNTPEGTLIWSEGNRHAYSLEHDMVYFMYMFALEPGSISSTGTGITAIRNINFRGPNTSTDFNIGIYDADHSNRDLLYSGGIIIPAPGFIRSGYIPQDYGYNYEITGCQIAGFSHAGIWIENRTDRILIEHCYIHHVKSNTIKGSGYEIYSDVKISNYNSTDNTITISHCILDDGKQAWDATAHSPFNALFADNSVTQLTGGINRHNNSGTYYAHPAVPGCSFYHEQYGCQNNLDICEDASVPFRIDDCSAGNTSVTKSIFIGPVISTQYPAKFGFVPSTSTTPVAVPGGAFVLCNNGNQYYSGNFIGSIDNGGWNITAIAGYTPFDFLELGMSFSSCYVSTNGFIQFDATNTSIANSDPSFFPYEINPNTNNIIALCLTDLDPSNSTGSISCWYESSLNAFIVDYNNIKVKGSSESVSGQILLYDNLSIEIRLFCQDIISATTERFLGIIGPSGNAGAVAGYTIPNGVGTFTTNCNEYPEGSCTPIVNEWNILDHNGVCTPFAWICEPATKYVVTVTDNVTTSTQLPISTCDDENPTSQRQGYAAVANNDIESCVFAGDNAIVHNNNTLGFYDGMTVNTGCPQPPNVTIELTDNGGNPLPSTANISVSPGHTQVQYLSATDPYKVSFTQNINGQKTGCLIRRNTNSQPDNPSATDPVTSINNFYYDHEIVIAPTTASPFSTTSLFNEPTGSTAVNLPGLYGIDVLAMDGAGSPGDENYYTAGWKHFPLIIVPPDETVPLIFNIKDSYQEFHHLAAYGNLSTPTGILKECYINNILVWSEDIADGGDGWERVEINRSTIVNALNTNNIPNILKFTIRSDGTTDPTKVKGVVVWVDDVYLKMFGMPDNLIEDGDIERSMCDGLGTVTAPGCFWFKETPQSSCSEPPGPGEYYPNGHLMPSITTYMGSVYIGTKERKSGIHALELVLPKVSCVSQYDAGIIASACAKFDFTGLMDCNEFTEDLVTDLSNCTSPPCTLTNKKYLVTSSITISKDVRLEGCLVSINPNVRITVPAGINLTLAKDPNSSATTTLFACSEMWEGIVVEADANGDPGKLAVTEGTRISDAAIAITADGMGYTNTANVPELTIGTTSRVTFDHNIEDIRITNGNFSSAQIWRTDFLCSGKVIHRNYTGTLPGINNRYGLSTAEHIYLENVNPITIGNATGLLDNTFSDARYGIVGYTTNNLTALQNNFYDITSSKDENHCAIVMIGMDDTPAKLTSGNTSGAGRNTFTRCDYGIVCYGEVESTVLKNRFKDCRETAIYHSYALTNVQPQNIPIELTGNIIENSLIGILLYEITNIPDVKVNDNTITGGYDAFGFPKNDWGIALFNSFEFKVPLEFKDNTITDYPIGMLLLNANIKDHFRVTGNTIDYTINKLRLGASTRLYRGITMQNCDGAEVGNNTIEWQSGMTDPDEINLYADQVQGIRVDGVTGSTIHNNTVSTCGTGMHVENDCSGSYLTCNQLNDNYPGLNLVLVTLPQQGDACTAAGNSWDIASGEDKVNQNSTTASGFPLDYYYSGSGAPSNPLFPVPPTLATVINPVLISTCNPSSCGGGQGQQNLMAEDTTKKDEELLGIVDEPLEPQEEFEFTEEAGYSKQEYAYQTMQQIPDLINTDDREDFMDSTEQNNIGKLGEVEELMIAGELTEASTKNSNVVDTNLIEQNKKSVNGIYLNTALNNSDTLTVSDSTALNQIAHQLAMQGGEAVYWARGKLRLYIEDHFVSNLRKTSAVHDGRKKSAGEVTLYPNPASSKLDVSTDLFAIEYVTIINTIGETLKFEIAANSKKLSMDISNLNPGVYFVAIHSADATVLKKLTIIR